jgi:predicted aconitase with swiveling domain
MELKAEVVIGGAAQGPALRLSEPISFWGGVDPASGRLSDPRAALHGESIAGRVLLIEETRGSSSSSAIMLELLARGLAPAAIVLDRVDAILGLGVIVARELGYPTIPLLRLDRAQQAQFRSGELVQVLGDGLIRRID